MSPVTDHTASRLLAIVAKEQVAARMPSLVAGVVRDGALAWSGSHGVHTGAGEPGPDVQYRIGSITKTMTAVVVLALRDEGLLDLDETVGHHLPGVGYADRTLRSLLTHSSGMQSEPAGEWWERTPGLTFEELAATVDHAQAAFRAGETFHYTNLAFGLLGEIVARRTGSSWWEQVRERILLPLGMHRTSYLPEPPHASGYSVHHFASTLTPEPAHDSGAMAPAGQVWSTLADLARYAAFLVDGNPEVLSPETLREMRTPQSGSLAGGLSGGHGLGVRLLAGGSGTLVGHSGSMPGFLAGLFTDPVRRTAAVCLGNGTVGLRCEGLPVDLLAELERSEPAVPAPWTPTEDLPRAVEEILGVWHWGNTAYGFSFDGQEVLAGVLGATEPSLRFRARPDGTFVGTSGYHHGETLHVVRTEGGAVSHLVCATFVYTRTPYDPAAPIPGGVPDTND